MERQRYPAVLLVTAQEFAGFGWTEALGDAAARKAEGSAEDEECVAEPAQ
jgi:hypothetical protein